MVEAGLIVVVCLAIAVSVVIVKRGADRSGKPVENTELPDIELDVNLQAQMRTLASQGHTEQAIKLLRKQAKLSPHEATLVVHALMVGRVFPDPSAAANASETGRSAVIDDELLGRLHALVAQDPVKRTAAIQLLRDRTGMNVRDARRFVNAL
ncbi:hypothetical protein G1H11_19500 [Phytoactinopolyspora alkaliphila]|uniref:Ribosomal protein L7/L12 C-terminal domain-containing protein n=1 Tax=Phytoactinopolyspora alkaliphila TaxID=1783498 RepID=A0A6N9YR03_9ACTN|nr:hypothetical protein [Phytoactinopolyspora alkaliphila]NED97486.1 hypothetical protein [Phytoactinopolyspora alkaliphila]